MTENNGILEKTGVVQAIGNPTPVGGKAKFGVKLDDGWYDGFGVLLEGVVKGSTVKVRYRNKGQYHNVIDGGVELVGSDTPKANPAVEEKCQTTVGDFKPSDEIDDLTNMMDDVAILYGGALERVEKLLDRKPKTDGELASVNSFFIEVCKRAARGRGI
jgi:hypothetical protein